MNRISANKLCRQLCLIVAFVFSVSVAAQRDFSTIRTGVNATDAKIIERGVKAFERPKDAAHTRGNGFDDDNKDHYKNNWNGYEYYRYTYPSISAKGEPITLRP